LLRWTSSLGGSAVLVCAALVASGCNDGPAPSTEVTLQTVRHKQFLEELKKHQGKVILVDVWGWF